MKKFKILTILSLSALCLGTLISTQLFNTNTKEASVSYYNGLPVSDIHASFAYDMSTPEKAIGAADYVFIAKIDKIVRTEYRNPVEIEIAADKSKTKIVSEPYTIYSVRVIKNIKGSLNTFENIEVQQLGGISESENEYFFLEDTKLLKVGEAYLLLAFVPFENGSLEINSADTIVNLKQSYTKLGVDEVKNSIDTDSAVFSYEKASAKQVIPNYKENYVSKYDSAKN